MSRSHTPAALWIREARAGAEESMGQLFDDCRGYLMGIARRELDPGLQAKGGASDIVQETFLEAHRDFGQFTGQTEQELIAWLRQRLLHKVSRFVRSYRQTAKRSARREVPLDGLGSSAGAGRALAAPNPSPSDCCFAGERDRHIEEAVRRLPEDHRRVIHLRYREDLTFEQIGEAMGRTANSARKLWGRAIERLERDLRGMTF